MRLSVLLIVVVMEGLAGAQGLTDLDGLWRPVEGTRRRASSSNPTGANQDYLSLAPGQRGEFLNLTDTSGCIRRIWMTVSCGDPNYLSRMKITMAFDGHVTVDAVPLGFLTGTGPWRVNDLATPVLNVMRARQGNRDQDGVGAGSFNIHWPMPFTRAARIEVHNGTSKPVKQFFYVDYLEHPHPSRPLLFHATYRVESPTTPVPGKTTLDARSNYAFLDVAGYRGQYVGTLLCVESHPDRQGKWYEGDDMFVIDGEPWPPRLSGTGTEDYFGMSWGVHRRYQAFDHGVVHYERDLTDHDRYFDGRFVVYRWHLADPIAFERSLHASIEAGHANECAQHYESMAFWYGVKQP
jgi:hypothetical protein